MDLRDNGMIDCDFAWLHLSNVWACYFFGLVEFYTLLTGVQVHSVLPSCNFCADGTIHCCIVILLGHWFQNDYVTASPPRDCRKHGTRHQYIEKLVCYQLHVHVFAVL